MATERALDRLSQRVSEINRSQHLFEIQNAGDHIIIHSGARAVQRGRFLMWGIGVLGICAGLALSHLTPWNWLLSAAGMAMFVLAPLCVYQKELLQFSLTHGLLIVMGKTPGNIILPRRYILHVYGVHEATGRTARTRIYVALREGSDYPVLEFPGADTHALEVACEVLGYVLNCPSTCTDLDGSIKRCYAPDSREKPDILFLQEFSAP